MARFSERQKKIALELLKGEKSEKELAEALKIHPEDIHDSLQVMLKLGVVEKKGEKFCLKKSLVEELNKRKELIEEDPFELRLNAIIEMQAVEKSLLEKQLEKLAKAINEDENFNVYSLEKADIIETDSGNYSTFIEVSFSARDFKSIIHFMFFYGPSSVEVIRPPEIKLKADDLQEGLMDLVEMVHKYTEYITKIMTREDIEKFTKQLFK